MGERVFRKIGILAALGWAAIAFEATAKADVFSFTYSELAGSFTADGPDSGLFSAVDQLGVLPVQTEGDVSRLVPVADSVVLNFADAAIGSASVDLSVATTAITDDDALASGSLTLVDVDGDTITGDISGEWIRVGASANLVALLTGITLTNTSLDGTFDGTGGNAWSMTFDEPQPFVGNVITLAFGAWFTDGGGDLVNFQDVTTLASGAVSGTDPLIPEPATLSLALIAGWIVIRRRRATQARRAA